MTELEAELQTVSADATEDQGTGASFCTARLLIGDAELSKPNGKVFLPKWEGTPKGFTNVPQPPKNVDLDRNSSTQSNHLGSPNYHTTG